MSAIEHLTIPLSVETAEAMRSQVAAGAYADLGKLVEAALLALALDRYAEEHPITDEAMRREVLAAMEEYDRDPSTGVTVEQLRASLAAARVERAKRR